MENTVRVFGWLLIIAATCVLLVEAFYEFARADTESLLIKLSTGALVLGLILIFLSVWRQRMEEAKSDPYTEIEK